MVDHLIIPDAHADPDHSNERFDILGQFIFDQRPDVIVCLGDFADMASLSAYDKGKKSFEGRRYIRDVEATKDALARLERPINEYNQNQARNKKAQYKPRKIMLLGNHENRINKVVNDDPKLEGTIGVDDLQYREHGWEVHPFLATVNVDGVYYSHFFISGVLGNAISSTSPAKAIIQKHMSSCTSGHSHVYDYAVATAPNGKRIHGLVAGCWVDYPMDFAHATQYLWVPSITIKRNVKDGDYDLEIWSETRVKGAIKNAA